MSNSLKDQLLGLGFKPVVQVASKPERSDASRHTNQRHPARPDAVRSQSERQRTPAPAEHKPRAGRGERGDRPRREAISRTREEIDLAKAYAIRAQKEKDERIEAERVKQEAARIKREAKTKIADMLKDASLNDPAAELTRHFDYNGKIRRIHVTEAQLKSLNAGALGVVQLDGRYMLVDAAITQSVRLLLPSLVALLVDPDAPAVDDPYADPKYVVPDDLMW